MKELADQLAQGPANGWLLVPSALVLGALHGLEPGHSKTMTAAFIVSIRGTIGQAVMLALAATVSHTAVVWVLAFLTLTWGGPLRVDAADPVLRIISGAMVLAMALWMGVRTWRVRNAPGAEDEHARAHGHELADRLDGRPVSTGQVVLFGLTSGLLPCAAAVTVLLLCLQMQRVWLGMALVLCFSIGLAATLMLSGVFAAWGAGKVARRWKGVDAIAARAPYGASAVLACLGLCMGLRGIMTL